MSEEVNEIEGIDGNWDDDFAPKEESGQSSQGDSGNEVQYMKMDKPGTYKVRLVGSYVKVRKHFKPYRATVLDSKEGKESSPAWKAGFTPSKRFAINVIDKTGLEEGETGVLKVLEKGPSVFQNFSAWKGVTGKDPGKKDGHDFAITVSIPKKDDGTYNVIETKYQVIPLEAAPFTEAEQAMIKEQGLYELKKLFKPTSTEKMQEMWDALDDDKKVAPPKPWEKNKTEEKASKPAPSEKVEEPAPSGADVFAETSSAEDPTDLF